MDKIKLKNIRIHTNHGCLKEEELIGSDYIVNLVVWTPLKASMLSDNLTDTVDYVILNKIIKEEMEKRSKLLENVCSRILNRLFFEQKNILKAKIEVAKQKYQCRQQRGDLKLCFVFEEETQKRCDCFKLFVRTIHEPSGDFLAELG